MGRTQVYLGGDEIDLLDRAAEETGASRSELIRRAVRRVYGTGDSTDPLRVILESAGTWESDGAGSGFVDEFRSGDLNERLARFGVK